MKKTNLLVNLLAFCDCGRLSEIINLKEEKLFSLILPKVSVNGQLAMLLFWSLSQSSIWLLGMQGWGKHAWSMMSRKMMEQKRQFL